MSEASRLKGMRLREPQRCEIRSEGATRSDRPAVKLKPHKYRIQQHRTASLNESHRRRLVCQPIKPRAAVLVNGEAAVFDVDNPDWLDLILSLVLPKGHGGERYLHLSKNLIYSKTAQVLATGIFWKSEDGDEPLSEAGSDPAVASGAGSAWSGSALGSVMTGPGISNNRTRGRSKRKRDDDPPDERGPKRPRTDHTSTGTNHNNHPPFACPFYLYDPDRYTCQGLRRIVDVRQHIFRDRHAQVRHCPTCGKTFDSDGARNEHIRQRACQPMPYYHPGATPDQYTQLRQVAQRQNITGGDPERWFMMWDILFPGITRPNSPYLWIAAPDLRRAHTMFERFLRSGAVWSVVDQWLPHDVDDGMRQQAHRNIQQSVQSYLEFWGHQEAISVVQRPVVDSAYSSQLSQPRTPTVLRNNSSGALQTNYSLVRQVVPADAIREPQIHNQSISTFPESLDEEESSGD